MTPQDYVRLLDQDLADATKAYKQAEKLLLRTRLRLVHLASEIWTLENRMERAAHQKTQQKRGKKKSKKNA